MSINFLLAESINIHTGKSRISVTLKTTLKLNLLLNMEVPIAIYGNEFSFGIVFSVAEILKFPV
jgi:hypothetical protein